MLARRADSVLVLIDMQPSFLSPIHQGDQVLRRCKFLMEIANLLGVPVIATEQYPSRMGSTHEELSPLLQTPAIDKMSFSCGGSDRFNEAFDNLRRSQAVLIGIETPICVNQTAHDLLGRGYEVLLAADAIGARSLDMHAVGMRRMEQRGAISCHTESIAYEWLESAVNPHFRGALAIVKAFAERNC